MKTVLYAQCSAQDPDHYSFRNFRQYFREAGWTVIDFDYEIERLRLGDDEMRRLFRLVCRTEKPALVWHSLYTDEFGYDDLRDSGCPVIGFASDDKMRLSHSLEYAAGHDVMLTTEPSAVREYHGHGQSVVWVPWCVTASQYPRAEGDGEGVVFIGQALPYRIEFLSQLRARGLNVSVHGPGWGTQAPLTWGTMVKLIHRSAVVLGMCECSDGSGLQVKGRHAEIPALGRVHVVNDDPDVEARYGPAVAPCRYRDAACSASPSDAADECVDVIRGLLDNVELRRDIAREAYEDVTARFTWDRWLDPIIGEVL